MKKKLISLLVVGIFVVSALTGCGSSSEGIATRENTEGITVENLNGADLTETED